MARRDRGISSTGDLSGATVCVTSGTTTELNLADFSRQNNLGLEALKFSPAISTYRAYEQGQCDVMTGDRSQLAAVRSGFSDPGSHIIFPETISKEPLTPLVPHGDGQWFDLVKVVLYVLINAEELGVTQSNVEDMRSSESIAIKRMLGVEGEFGQAELGLSPDFAVDVIQAVGNYGEIYDRHMAAEGDAFYLPRGINELWFNGGLIYAPPLQ